MKCVRNGTVLPSARKKNYQEACPTGPAGKMPLIVKVVFLLVMFGDNCYIMRRLLDLSTDLDAKEKCFRTWNIYFLLSQN